MQDTYFAKAERSSDAQLNDEIKIIAESPLISNLMTTIGGLLAVLDENRQIVALNQAMLKIIGVDSVEEILGCRPGEAFHCIHSAEMPYGCGTTKSCRTCGAVIAIVSSLELNKPVEKICIAEIQREKKTTNLYLGVRAAPIELSNRRFILLFLQDLSAQQELATLERIFFHDVNNILTSLLGYSEILTLECSGAALKTALIVNNSAKNLCREVAIQRFISHGELGEFECNKENISVNSIIEDTCTALKQHPSALKKIISSQPLVPDKIISSDQYLIVKILTNMLLNALEASDEGDSVKIWTESTPKNETVFSVWNNTVISDDLKQRLFQKNFSTKKKKGRGLGTYSMKLFGEEILKGEVYFSSEKENGTTFYLKL